jgi:hypothetical protein
MPSTSLTVNDIGPIAVSSEVVWSVMDVISGISFTGVIVNSKVRQIIA